MKSFKTIISAGFLASALAGCGGGSSDDDGMEEMPMEKTPEEMCTDAGNNWYEGDCYTDQQLFDMGVEQGEENAANEQTEKDRLALAKQIFGFLNARNAGDTAFLVAAPPTDGRPDIVDTTAGDVMDAYDAATDADNMMGSEEKAQVVFMTTQDDGRQVDMVPGLTSRTVPHATLVLPANARHIVGSGFAKDTNEVVKHTDLKEEGDRDVIGSYMGAMGKFTCPSATDCTSRRTDDGIQLLGASDAWTFTPNTDQKFTAPDTKYAQYGWWLDENLAATAARIGAWYANGADGAGLPDEDISATGSNATGSATYTGTAIGQVALYHRLGGDTNVGGAFTADAELTATFGTTPMLGGMIDNFDIGGEQPDWEVKLNKTPLTATTSATTPTSGSEENTTVWNINGTDGDAGGSWSAKLYDVPPGGHQPKGVAGGFQASYESDGHMVGAFGAEQK